MLMPNIAVNVYYILHYLNANLMQLKTIYIKKTL